MLVDLVQAITEIVVQIRKVRIQLAIEVVLEHQDYAIVLFLLLIGWFMHKKACEVQLLQPAEREDCILLWVVSNLLQQRAQCVRLRGYYGRNKCQNGMCHWITFLTRQTPAPNGSEKGHHRESGRRRRWHAADLASAAKPLAIPESVLR